MTAQLRRLGEAAADVNRHVVLLVDELQAGNAASIQGLSTALQETNADQLPVGLVAAGLPTTTARLRAIGGVTFLERQRITRLGNLEPGDARDAIERPLIDRGRRYDPEILPILVDAADGYPYALQLVAERTWDAAEEADEISIVHARRGVTVARAELDTLYEGRWSQLAPAQQDYLVAVVDQLQPDGSAASDDVAAALGRTTKQLSKQREALIIRHQLLYADAQNSLRIALPGLADWVRNHPGATRPRRQAPSRPPSR